LGEVAKVEFVSYPASRHRIWDVLPQSILEVIIAIALGAWLLLSILVQVWPRLEARIRHFDVLQFVTRYTFFAPDPPRTYGLVLRRCHTLGGCTTDWAPVLIFQRRTAVRALWNPQRCGQIGFAKDCSAVALAVKQNVGRDDIEASLPFRRLRGVASHDLPVTDATHLEWRLWMVTPRADGSNHEELVFESGLMPRSGQR
jgi:hypothetical protein